MSFCSACLEHHDEIFDHQQQRNVDKSGDVASSTIGEECAAFCDTHKLPVTLYCNLENTFGCKICMDSDHKHCIQVTYLPVYARALLRDINVTNLNEMLDKTIQELEMIRLMQQSLLSSLIEDKENSLKKVNKYHTRQLEKFNAIFRSTTDAIDKKFETVRAEIKNNMQQVERSLAELESSRFRIEQFQDKHDQKFIEIRKCQKCIKMAELVSTEAADNLKIKGIDVFIDERLDNILNELKSLASVAKRRPMQVKKTYQTDVFVKEDFQKCDITASCVLRDFSILLVDYSNKKLKRLDCDALTIIDTYSSEDKPIGVCCINEDEVAVTTNTQQVVLLAILPKLRLIRKLTFNHRCGYVANYEDELFITDVDRTLYVYTMQGSLLRKFKTDTAGNGLFSTARHVVVNDRWDTLFVTDGENGFLKLNRHCLVVKRVDNLKSSGTRGVCLDEAGGAFVCGHSGNKVAYINPEGQHVIDVLTKADGLQMPKSVCFQRTRRRLLVSQESRNQMIVCELI